jgi:hypothetical protein
VTIINEKRAKRKPSFAFDLFVLVALFDFFLLLVKFSLFVARGALSS